MLPSAPQPPGRLAEVLGTLVDQVSVGADAETPSGLRKAVIVVVDGLGASSLREARGHARFLSRRWADAGSTVSTHLPSTTASSLASITTGQPPGIHGLLGYQVRVPGHGVLLNHLKPFPSGVQPHTWQGQPTLFERAASQGIPSIAVGEPKFEHSDFTRSILRGARYIASRSLDHHRVALRDFFDSVERGVAYLYWPALDRLGHEFGPGSVKWCDALEGLDSFAADLDRSLAPDEGGLVTADHGMVTVAHERQIVFPADHPLRREVALWGGEPRLVQLYLRDPARREIVAEGLQDVLGERCSVWLREQAIERGLFGEVLRENIERLGDVLVFAEGDSVLYDEQTASTRSREMLGHHGSWSTDEVTVPVIPLGPRYFDSGLPTG